MKTELDLACTCNPCNCENCTCAAQATDHTRCDCGPQCACGDDCSCGNG